jgi:hypothetical protein
MIGGRTMARYRHEDLVTLGVDREVNLRKVRVSAVAARVPVCPTFGELATDVARFQAGPIHGNQANAVLLHSGLAGFLQLGVEHPPARDGDQQSNNSLLKRGEMRDDLHADVGSNSGVVRQVSGEAAVVETQELFGHQTGQRLGFRELLRAEEIGVRRQCSAGRLVGDLKNRAGDSLVVT